MNVQRNYLNSSQVVSFREFEHLRLFLVAVFLSDIFKSIELFVAFEFLRLSVFLGIDKPHLGGDREEGKRAVDDDFVEFILEKILFHG